MQVLPQSVRVVCNFPSSPPPLPLPPPTCSQNSDHGRAGFLRGDTVHQSLDWRGEWGLEKAAHLLPAEIAATLQPSRCHIILPVSHHVSVCLTPPGGPAVWQIIPEPIHSFRVSFCALLLVECQMLCQEQPQAGVSHEKGRGQVTPKGVLPHCSGTGEGKGDEGEGGREGGGGGLCPLGSLFRILCTCAHTHTYAHTRTHMHAHTHTHTYTHAHTHTHTHTHIHTHMYTHAHTCTHTRTHIHTRMHTHTRTHTSTHRFPTLTVSTTIQSASSCHGERTQSLCRFGRRGEPDFHGSMQPWGSSGRRAGFTIV